MNLKTLLRNLKKIKIMAPFLYYFVINIGEMVIRSSQQFEKILEFREKKSKELKRLISYSEAMALWLSESVMPKQDTSRKQLFTR